MNIVYTIRRRYVHPWLDKTRSPQPAQSRCTVASAGRVYAIFRMSEQPLRETLGCVGRCSSLAGAIMELWQTIVLEGRSNRGPVSVPESTMLLAAKRNAEMSGAMPAAARRRGGPSQNYCGCAREVQHTSGCILFSCSVAMWWVGRGRSGEKSLRAATP
jgi:hypothetical protein